MKKLKNRGMTGQVEAGMVIGLIMVAIVMAVFISNLDSAMLDAGTTGAGFYTTYGLIKTLGWVALTLDAIGIIAIVGKWIISIFA